MKKRHYEITNQHMRVLDLKEAFRSPANQKALAFAKKLQQEINRRKSK